MTHFLQQRIKGWFAFCLAIFICTLASQAQSTSPASAVLSSNRFLFVVETSLAVKSRAPAILKIIDEILTSSGNAQMHDGDTVGLWTFGEDVHSELPLQTWKQSTRAQVSDHVTAFLKQQHFEKTGEFEKVLPNLFGVMRASDFITVIIISSGDAKMKGTPFDEEMNAQYSQSIKDMKGQRMPVVTVMQAGGSKLLRYVISALPWPVVIPDVPIRTVPTIAIQSTITNQPLITNPVKTPTIVQPAVVTAPPVAVVTPATIPQPALPKPAPAPIIKVEPTPQQPTSVPSLTVSKPAVVTPPPISITEQAQPVLPATIIESQTAPPMITPAVTTPTPPPNAVPPVAVPLKTPAPQLAAPSVAPEPPIAALAPVTVERSKSLLFASIALVVIALILILVMVLRARSSSGPSLITHAITNKKK